MTDNTISLYKLRNKINACLLDKFNYVINQTESFKLANSSNPKYGASRCPTTFAHVGKNCYLCNV